MKIEELLLKAKKIEKIKEIIKIRKEALSNMRYPCKKQILQVKYKCETGYSNDILEFTSNEVIQILKDSINNLQKEIEDYMHELNGQVIEISEEEIQ